MAPTLQVGLEAKLDKLQEGFDQAVKMSEEAVQKIEESFSNANPKLSGFLGGLTGGLIGAGAAEGLGRVLDAIKNIVHELANLDTIARRVGLTLDELQAFRFAASTSGVSEGDFASGLNQMAARLNEAGRKENDLTKLFEANNLSVKDTNGNLMTMVDLLTRVAALVKNARTEQDKFKIAELAGATKELVPFLERGAEAITQVAVEAEKSGNIIDEATIKKAAEFDQK